MYEDLNCFEEALRHFGIRVEVITAMEMANKISSEDAYQMVKDKMRDLKSCRKKFNKKGDCNGN